MAAASRPYPGETENGDAWGVVWHGDRCRVALVDGLGHGPEAASASRLALETLQRRPALPLLEAFTACHRALAGSRGAVMAVVDIDVSIGMLSCAGVGNIEGQFSGPSRDDRLVSDRGIVGSSLPHVHPQTLQLTPDWLLVLHSDGVSSRFDVRRERSMPGYTAQALADAVLANWARPNDDATVVVIGPRLDDGSDRNAGRGRYAALP